MKLNVHERMILVPLLPEEESFAGMGEIVRLKLTLQLTGEEADELVIDKDGRQQLDVVKASAHIKEIPISEWMMKQIKGILRKLDDAKKLKENQLSLYEKFVMDYDQR